jgi:diketogulonate reductase-like aldo/keto reductase
MTDQPMPDQPMPDHSMPDPSLDHRSVPLSAGGEMPLLGLGTWQLRGRTAREATAQALEVGYRLVDTATAYGNEAEVGAAIRESGLAREEVFITTKLPAERADRASSTLAESLRLLGLDHVDLWLIHWPPRGAASPRTWEHLIMARESGLARHVGVSNYSTAQIDELVAATGVTPEVNQVEWAPVLFDPARVAHHRAAGVVLEGYSPFRASRLDDPVLVEVAAVHGVTSAQVILRWHVQHDVVAIPRSARPERIAANADLWGFRLTEEQMRRIDALGKGS